MGQSVFALSLKHIEAICSTTVQKLELSQDKLTLTAELLSPILSLQLRYLQSGKLHHWNEAYLRIVLDYLGQGCDLGKLTTACLELVAELETYLECQPGQPVSEAKLPVKLAERLFTLKVTTPVVCKFAQSELEADEVVLPLRLKQFQPKVSLAGVA